MPDDGFARMRVELFPFGHVFRAGSKVRGAIESPGGNRGLWGFVPVVEEPVTNAVAHTAEMASNVKRPLVPSEDADFGSQPTCGTLRTQPCRLDPA